MTNLTGKRIHFIGIGGVGVNALARYALDSGATVSGSDAKFSEMCKRLSNAGARVYEGEDPKSVEGADAVVFTSALRNDNSELMRARELNIPIYERHKFLQMIASSYDNVVGIAGTHGKTTTTAMLAHMLANCNKKFVGMIGGDSVDFSNYVNNSCGTHDIFIVEACEYKRNFLSLNPSIAVVTNVECDHPDCYENYDSVKQAFSEYLSSAGDRIYLKSDDGRQWEIERDNGAIKSDYRAELKDGECLMYKDGEHIGNIKLKDGGDYNYKNATFAIISAEALGVNVSEAIAALSTFKGVGRRFEHVGDEDGTPVYFDFAHHPTEIGCVLRRASEYGKILAVFQPHTYSRTKAYFENFVDVFGNDKNIGELIFMPTYAARERFDKSYEVDALAKAIEIKYSKQSHVASDPAEVVQLVKNYANVHDIILFIGAGDIYDLKHMFK